MAESPKSFSEESKPQVDIEATVAANRERILGSIAAGQAELRSGKELKSLDELLASEE